MSGRRRQDAEAAPPPEPTRLAAAQARFDQASAAVERAEANIAEAGRRLAEAETALAKANEAATTASLTVLQDPGAEALLDDAVLQATAAERRRDLLLKNTLPAATAALPPREEELESAREELRVERMREAVRTELLPADRKLMAAMSAAVSAMLMAEEVRASIKSRFTPNYGQYNQQWDGIHPVKSGIPSEISRRLTPQIGTGTYGGVQLITVSTGRDLVAEDIANFDLEESA